MRSRRKPFSPHEAAAIEQFVRDNPSMPHKEVVRVLASLGFNCSYDQIYRLRAFKGIPSNIGTQYFTVKIQDLIKEQNIKKSEVTPELIMSNFPDIKARYAQKISREIAGPKQKEIKQSVEPKKQEKLKDGQKMLPSGIITRTGNLTVHRMF